MTGGRLPGSHGGGGAADWSLVLAWRQVSNLAGNAEFGDLCPRSYFFSISRLTIGTMGIPSVTVTVRLRPAHSTLL